MLSENMHSSLKSLRLNYFKSYREALLPIAPFTVLIGANASGKSNAIEALHFLHGMATGRYFDDIYKDLQDAGILRGRRNELVWEKGDRFALAITVDDPPDQLTWQIGLLVQPELVVEEERLTFAGETISTFEAERREDAPPHTVIVRYNNFARGGKKPTLWADDRQPIFAQLNTPVAFTTRRAQQVIPKRVESLRAILSNIHFLEPRPARMRDYAPIDSGEQLSPDGKNVSAVLYNICEEKGQKHQVLEFIRSLPEGEITAIDFIETSRNDVMLQITEQFGARKQTWDAAMLSDGTLRVLAVAAALLSAPEGSLIVIEEIDNGVHPSRADMLIKRMMDVVQARSLRVLLTTHNPALLDALPVALYQDVVYCYRDRKDGDSRLIRLAELPDYPALMMQGSLGALLARRLLEEAVQQPNDGAWRHQQSLEWLKAWQAERV